MEATKNEELILLKEELKIIEEENKNKNNLNPAPSYAKNNSIIDYVDLRQKYLNEIDTLKDEIENLKSEKEKIQSQIPQQTSTERNQNYENNKNSSDITQNIKDQSEDHKTIPLSLAETSKGNILNENPKILTPSNLNDQATLNQALLPPEIRERKPSRYSSYFSKNALEKIVQEIQMTGLKRKESRNNLNSNLEEEQKNKTMVNELIEENKRLNGILNKVKKETAKNREVLVGEIKALEELHKEEKDKIAKDYERKV